MESVLNKLRRFYRQDNISIIENTLDVDRYTILGDYCMLVTWQNPYYTMTHFILFNFFVWLSISSQIKVLSLIASIVLMKFIYHSMIGTPITSKKVDPELEESCKKSRALLSKFLLYRSENPKEFCLKMSLFFMILAVISTKIPGELVNTLVVWFVFLVPLAYKHMPLCMEELLDKLFYLARVLHDTIEEDDLLPLPVEERAEDNDDLDSLNTEITADSLTNSLVSGISSMPSFLDGEDNQEILEEDLIPTDTTTPPLFADGPSDSESEEDFREIHMNLEESSSDEEGLHFEEITKKIQERERLFQDILDFVTNSPNPQSAKPSNSAAIDGQNEKTHVSREGSTSDEDFEIIDANELNH